MQTIEERAKEYAPDAFDTDYILPAREGYIVNLQRKAYIAGAIEQKAIDDEFCRSGEASDGYHTFNELYDFRRE